MTIHELAKLPGLQTDKSDANHTFLGQNYLHVYEQHFERIRERVNRILEIGIGDGNSLRLWRSYFPNAQVWGLDINPALAIQVEDRIRVVIGNQSDPQCLASLAEQAGGFDLIIDDGSHIVASTLDSFKVLWPAVRSGGTYAIEDTGISYHPSWLREPHVIRFNGDVPPARHDRKDFDSLFLNMVKDMDKLTGTVRALHFHPMMIFISAPDRLIECA